jgi:hypothetical protein
MSIFVRPESPPPRAPSPEYFTGLNPLPIRKRSQATIRSSTATLSSEQPKRPILRATQSDSVHSPAQLLGHDLTRSPSKGILKHSPPPSSGSSIVSRHSSSTASSRTLSHHRSLPSALPCRSPSASPTLAIPPPLPPLPSFVLTDTEKKKLKKRKSQQQLTPEPVERKRRQSRASEMTSRLFAFCTSGRSVAVCTA